MGSSDSSLAISSSEKSFHDEYTLGRELGRGSFAHVRVAVSVVDGKASTVVSTTERAERAVKILDLRSDTGQTQPLSPCGPQITSRRKRKFARMEATLWKILGNHDNCVSLHDVFFEPSFCYMVMERCHSSLWQHLEQISDLTERSMGRIFHQMLHGIAHLHSVHIVHRDVKPSNFLVGGDDLQTIKLGDFGLSASLLASDELRTVCGTAPFMSPEMLTNKYDEKTDVWSFGVVAYALLFGDFPYMPSREDRPLFKKAIVKGNPPTFAPRDHNSTRWPVDNDKMRTGNAIRFVKTLLERNPVLRPTAQASLATIYMHQAGMNCHAHGVELPSLRPALLSAKQVGVFGSCSFDEADVEKLLAEPEQGVQPVLVPMPADAPLSGQIEICAEKHVHLVVHSDSIVRARTPADVDRLSDHSTFCSTGDNDTVRSLDAESLRSNPAHSNLGQSSDIGTPRTAPFALQDFDQSQTRVVEFLLPSTLRKSPS